MLPGSLPYFIFFAIVWIIYSRFGVKGQNIILLFASYFFYGYWDVRLLCLLIVCTGISYIVVLKIDACTEHAVRKKYMLIGVLAVLGILAFFKYYNFFVGSLNNLAISFGFKNSITLLNLIVPVGLSFYIFQLLSYILDVYRGEQQAIRDPIIIALYAAFFPTLLSGPIERSRHLIPQIEKPRSINANSLHSGTFLILTGLFKKFIIADFLALRVNEIFAQPEGQAAGVLLEGVYLFTAQIYLDFSGYTDIVRGSAILLGFEICENFQQPYLAHSIADFWHRWHMSLSSWFRDYLYIPLGGNRKGRFRTYMNLFITMFLCGLWHGSQWTFVLWGGLHGIYLIGYRIFSKSRSSASGQNGHASTVKKILSIFLTFNVVAFTWVIFRADNIVQAYSYFAGLFSTDIFTTFPFRILLILAAVLAIDLPSYLSSDSLIITKWSWYIQGLIYAVILLLLGNLAGSWEEPFVYFAF